MGVQPGRSARQRTYAPLAALPVGAAAVLLVARRVPWRQLLWGLPALAVAGVVLWPLILGRVQQQLAGGGAGLRLPETLATRLTYWDGFFVPALLEHGPWLGTGTLIPSEVPARWWTSWTTATCGSGSGPGCPGWPPGAAAGRPGRGRVGVPAQPGLGQAGAGRDLSGRRHVDGPGRHDVRVPDVHGGRQEFWMLAGVLAGVALTGRPAPAFGGDRPRRPGVVGGSRRDRRRLLPERALVRLVGRGRGRLRAGPPARLRLPGRRRPRAEARGLRAADICPGRGQRPLGAADHGAARPLAIPRPVTRRARRAQAWYGAWLLAVE